MKLGRRSAEAVNQLADMPTLASALNSSVAAFPRVNLVPPAIALEGRLRTAKLSVVAAVVISIAVIAGLYVLAQGQVNAAQDQLDSVTARTATLTTELQGFHDYQSARSDLADAQKELDLAMGGEVRWSTLINDISLTMPAGTALTELKGSISGVSPTYASKTAATSGTGGASSTPVSVLGNSGIGLITYSGEAASYAAVASFLDAISKQHTMLDPYPNSIQVNNAAAGSGSGQSLTFSATVTINDKALSNRWTRKAGS
jgi:Tfp pilus assembly protein PilN